MSSARGPAAVVTANGWPTSSGCARNSAANGSNSAELRTSRLNDEAERLQTEIAAARGTAAPKAAAAKPTPAKASTPPDAPDSKEN